MEIAKYIFLALFPVGFGFRDAYSIPKDNDKFHVMGYLIRSAVAILLIQEWSATLLYGAYFWIVFDISYNLFSKRKWNEEGTTSFIDQLFANENILSKAVVLVLTLGFYIYKFYIHGRS